MSDYLESPVSKLCDAMRGYSENLDRVFGTVSSSCSIAKNACLLAEKRILAFDQINSSISHARSVLGASRLIWTAEYFLAGKFLRKELNVKEEDDFEDENVVYFFRLAADVAFAAARIFSPLFWLDQIKVIRLGKHATWMDHVATGSIAGGVFLSTLHSGAFLYFYHEEYGEGEKYNQKRFAVIANCLDLTSVVWDGLKLNARHQALAITGCTIDIIANLAYLANEAWASDEEED